MRSTTLLQAIGALVVMQYLYKILRALRLALPFFLPANKSVWENLQTYHSPGAWIIITGASSGIGKAFARALAHSNFNLLLMARREDALLALRDEIRAGNAGIQVEYLCFDFSQTFARRDELESEFSRLIPNTSSNVAMLIHMAGNSELARHFTDKSIERNIELERLCVESTTVLLQSFCEKMARRYYESSAHQHQRSAIVTCGALTAHHASPVFAMASANKMFVRGLTLAAAKEFKQEIDLVCAHPIVVASEIVTRPPPLFTSSGSTFARNVLAQLGSGGGHDAETNASLLHDFVVWCWPMLGDFNLRHVTWVSWFLNRDVDMRELGFKV